MKLDLSLQGLENNTALFLNHTDVINLLNAYEAAQKTGSLAMQLFCYIMLLYSYMIYVLPGK